MKRLVFAALCLGLVAPSLATAERVGIGQSRDSFTIKRGETELVQRSQSLAALQSGDTVSASAAPLRIEGSNGSSLHLSRQSTVAFASDGTPVLEKGTLASASTAEAPAAVRHGALEAKPSGADRLLYVVSIDQDGLFTAQAMEGDLTIRSGEEQIAFLAAGDSITLASDGEVWQQAAAGTGAPTSIFRMQTVDDPDGGTEGRRPLGFIPGGATGAGIAGGAIALGAGGYIFYNEVIDDDDDDDDDPDDDDPFDRGLVSPIGPNFPITTF